MDRQKGFTLIELMVVVVVVALLAGIALPAYQEQIAKAKRADAVSALLTAAQALERFYTSNGRYLDNDGNLAAVFSTTVPQSGTAYYNITATAASNNAFTLLATRAGSMVGDRCGNLQLNSAGVKFLVGNDAGSDVAACWRR